MKFFYFGCLDQAGHYMHASPKVYELEERRAVSAFVYTNPWGTNIDGGLCTKDIGCAALHQKDGWTALAFWDSTIDSRPGSNSVFLAEGTFGFAEMCELAYKYFPEVASRIPYGYVTC